MTEPIEKITDETVIGEVCSADCMPEKRYHLNCIGFGINDLHEPYRQALLSSAEKEKELAELREDIRLRDIDCGCNARITEKDARIKELEFENKCVNELCKRRRLKILELNGKVDALTEKLRVAEKRIKYFEECQKLSVPDQE